MNKLLTWSAFVLLIVGCSTPWSSPSKAPGAPRGDLAPGQARLVLTAASGRALLSDAGFVTLGLTNTATAESAFATAAKAGNGTYTLVINDVTAGDWRLSARFYPSSEEPTLLFYASQTLYIAPGSEQMVNLAVYEPGVIGGITLGEAGLPSTIEVTNFQSGEAWTGPQTLPEGLPMRLLATLRDSDSNLTKDQRVEWLSSNPAVVSISAQGRLSPLRPGTAAVTVTSVADRRLASSFEVTVEASVAGYWRAPSGAIVRIVANPVGASFRISVVRNDPLGYETGPLTTRAPGRYEILLNRQLSYGLWEPGPSYSGTLVDNHGTITITGANFGMTPVILERITDPKPVTSLIVDASNPADLEVTVVPADATIPHVFWGSQTPATASIGLLTGVVTPLSEGPRSFLVSSLDNPQSIYQVWGSPAEGWLPSVTITGPSSVEANPVATFQVQTNVPAPTRTRWLLDGSVVSDRLDGSLAPLVLNTANLGAGTHQVAVKITSAGQVYDSSSWSFQTGSRFPVQVSSGMQTLYVKPDGSLWGWGPNNDYVLGLGSGGPADVGRPQFLDSNVAQVATGSSHSLYLKRDGTLWYMGTSYSGSTSGDGSGATHDTPFQVPMANIAAIAAGDYQSWVLKNDGTLWATGENGNGTLGTGDNASVLSFTQVFTDVAAVYPNLNSTVFALKTDGTLWSAGRNDDGQLGDGFTDPRNFFFPTYFDTTYDPLTGSILSVAVSYDFAVVVTTTGQVWTTGSDYSGQLGNGPGATSSLGFRLVANFSGAVKPIKAVASDGSALLLMSDGTIYATGNNAKGQLGDGTTVGRASFSLVDVVRPASVQDVFAKDLGFYYLLDDGSLWGSGGVNYDWGPTLGIGNEIPQNFPVPINTETPPPKIVTNGERTFAILADGTLKATGNQDQGALGNEVSADINSDTWVTIVPFADNKTFVAVAPGLDHTLFLLSDGTAWAVGVNTSGQLGDGSTVNRITPVQIGTGIKAIAAGADFSMLLGNNGTVKVFGSNLGGQLGQPLGTSFATSPQVVSGVSNAVALAAGSDFGLILTASGDVYSAGVVYNNGHGQAGVTATERTPYAIVPGLSSVIAIEAGEQFSFAIKADGTLWAAGWNAAGQLGVSSSTYPDLDSGFSPVWTKVKAVSAGGQHTLIQRTDGTVWGTGLANASGAAANISSPLFLGEALSVAAGMNNSFVVRPDGTLWWFGSDDLSNGIAGTQTATHLPQRVW